MAAITTFCQPFLYMVDNAGVPLSGAKIYFYEAGTATSLAVYTNVGLSVPWTQPVETDSAGRTSGPVYMTPTPAFKIRVFDADDVELDWSPVDNLSPAAVAT